MRISFQKNNSDPESATAVITSGLENILMIKAEKEHFSNGLDFCATIVTLNRDLEIVKNRQVFDVAQ